MKIIVTGAAGFIGYHLCSALLGSGHKVIGVDNFYTGARDIVEDLSKLSGFEFIEGDVRGELDFSDLTIDQVYHLACPASPPHYQKDPIFTLDTCYLGTKNILELARHKNATVLIASTSEIYGDAECHPQSETDRGLVNTWGPRACYDEGKRVGEALAFEYQKYFGVKVRVARIFNTYGPRMNKEDGRVMTNLILCALRKKPMTIYGTGRQTRSFCFVSDQVDGLIRLMNSPCDFPVNIGNPEEVSILQVAEIIKEITCSTSTFEFLSLPVDDPKRRCPDISKARQFLNWSPRVSLREGLNKMVDYYALSL